MRRRAPAERLGVPAHLARFDARDWPGRDVAEMYSAWMGARAAWAEELGVVELPGEAEARAAFPDGVFRLEEI